MFKEIPDLLTVEQVNALRQIAATAPFVDGRITNPHNTAKNNLQLHEQSAYEKSAKLIMAAMLAHEDFKNFTFPVAIRPPLLTVYETGMGYGAHADSAFIELPGQTIRSDISCTVFLSNPDESEGGDLFIRIGDAELRFKGAAGSAILYPSDTLHEVEAVTQGRRLVAITFIQSRIPDPWKRHMLYEISEIAALEGLKMSWDNLMRLQLFREKLTRHWAS